VSKQRTYLDWNATTPLRPEARAAMIAAMDVVGNPSSVHGEGRAAKGLIERARGQVAAAVGCKPSEVVFTSGATEAAMILARQPDGCRVIVDDTVHDAVWSHFDLPVGDLGEQGSSHTLAMGLANNETGIIAQPPTREDGLFVYRNVKAKRLLLDLTQAIGRIAFAFSWSDADFAILSAHKLGGPKGVGALIVREGLDIAPLATGGGQEMGRRAGTENLIGIAGFGAAAEAAAADLAAGVWDAVAQRRDQLEQRIANDAPETICVGKDAARLPNTSCLLSPGWKGETQVMQMDLAGYAISAGSACSSGKVRASRVLRAMGYDEADAACAIRVSIGPETTDAQLGGFADAWIAAHQRHRARAA